MFGLVVVSMSVTVTITVLLRHGHAAWDSSGLPGKGKRRAIIPIVQRPLTTEVGVAMRSLIQRMPGAANLSGILCVWGKPGDGEAASE